MAREKKWRVCDKPADVVTIDDTGRETYFCKNCYKLAKQAAIELGIPWLSTDKNLKE